MAFTPYCESESDMLKSLWLKGRTATEVAAAVNQRFGRRRTRSAVIGYVHRLGLTRGGRGGANQVRIRKPCKPLPAASDKPVAALPEAKRLKAGATTIATKRAQKARDGAPAAKKPVQVFPEARTRTRFLMAVPEPLKLDVLQLTDRTCRHAATERAPHAFCGHKTVPGKHWCPAHYERVYRHPEVVNA